MRRMRVVGLRDEKLEEEVRSTRATGHHKPIRYRGRGIPACAGPCGCRSTEKGYHPAPLDPHSLTGPHQSFVSFPSLLILLIPVCHSRRSCQDSLSCELDGSFDETSQLERAREREMIGQLCYHETSCPTPWFPIISDFSVGLKFVAKACAMAYSPATGLSIIAHQFEKGNEIVRLSQRMSMFCRQ